MVIPMNTLNHEDDLLIAQLHLQDAEELATRCERKGKGREGAPPTDSVYAFELQANFMKEYITEMRNQREADAFGRHGGRHPVARPTSANARAGSSRETQLYGGAHEETSAPPQWSRHSDRYSGEPWPAYSSSSYGRGSTDTMSNTLRMALSTLPDDLNAGYQPSYNENRERPAHRQRHMSTCYKCHEHLTFHAPTYDGGSCRHSYCLDCITYMVRKACNNPGYQLRCCGEEMSCSQILRLLEPDVKLRNRFEEKLSMDMLTEEGMGHGYWSTERY
ncbi:hypothetical protein AAF712_008886 [Marasmius tenuissimus]|uniref:RING-type domain-containing protein n=1 Tax=Marasmius tenuissimus TaxID=585030 RepID=A0ABR2ZTJ2_9AGAR